MEINEKLGLIKQLSGLTQVKMAQKLGVSFATLNSWINGRSQPHAKKFKLIDALYLKLTGQNVIPKDILNGKKAALAANRKKFKNIIKTIIERSDIFDQFILSLTYNTNRIEGSTLSENDTAAILFQNATLPDKNLIEHLEAKNHQSALQYLFRKVNKDFKISENFILELHHILMNSIRPDAGNYRSHGVRIVGANVPTANYLKVPEKMKSLVKEINNFSHDPIAHCTKIHSEFEKIHPFSDGNGRVGRLIMTAMLLKSGFPPAIIKQENKRFYYIYLQKSQQNGDFSQLEDFICDAVFEGFKILKKNI